jgi:hypothetical protein
VLAFKISVLSNSCVMSSCLLKTAMEKVVLCAASGRTPYRDPGAVPIKIRARGLRG